MNKKRETMEKAAEAYFARCDATRERYTLKSGEPAERQLPYTLYGLCGALELSAEQALSLARGEGVRWQSRLLMNAVNRIAAYTAERALLGELNHQVALATLTTLYPAGSEDGGGDGLLHVVLDEALRQLSE